MELFIVISGNIKVGSSVHPDYHVCCIVCAAQTEPYPVTCCFQLLPH